MCANLLLQQQSVKDFVVTFNVMERLRNVLPPPTLYTLHVLNLMTKVTKR